MLAFFFLRIDPAPKAQKANIPNIDVGSGTAVAEIASNLTLSKSTSTPVLLKVLSKRISSA